MLLNRVLIPNWFNNVLMNLDFFLPQIAQFDKGINLFCFVLLTLEFSFTVFFFVSDIIGFHQANLLIMGQYLFV